MSKPVDQGKIRSVTERFDCLSVHWATHTPAIEVKTLPYPTILKARTPKVPTHVLLQFSTGISPNWVASWSVKGMSITVCNYIRCQAGHAPFQLLKDNASLWITPVSVLYVVNKYTKLIHRKKDVVFKHLYVNGQRSSRRSPFLTGQDTKGCR